MSTEDEFAGKDPRGLLVRKKDGPQDDDAAMAKAQSTYMGMFFLKIPIIQLMLASGTYLALSLGLGKKEILDAKFEFLHTWDLGYVYLCIYIICLGRNRIMANSNAVRAGARLDRPDQHIYKIMDAKASKDAPFVLMANTGWAGKFNRAQRGAFNTDESIPAFLVNTLLTAAVFGPVVICITLLAVYGRVTFALKYTEASDKRGAGFLPALIGEQWTAGLVFFTAIKAIAGPAMPF